MISLLFFRSVDKCVRSFAHQLHVEMAKSHVLLIAFEFRLREKIAHSNLYDFRLINILRRLSNNFDIESSTDSLVMINRCAPVCSIIFCGPEKQRPIN